MCAHCRDLIGRFRLSTPAVSMSLTGSCFSSESAPRPFHHGIRGRGGTILTAALSSSERQVSSGLTNSPHPSSREGHHSTTWWSSSNLLSDLILQGCHAAAASLVHRNWVPSTQMRCRITASRRARATIAFFMPRRLAICIAQALSHDHLVETSSMVCAASYSITRIISSPHRDIAPVRSIAPDILGGRQSKHGPDCLGVSKAGRHVDGRTIGQRYHGADTRKRHQPPAHIVTPNDRQ